MATVDSARPITRDDIEAKLHQIQASTEVGADAAKGAGMVGLHCRRPAAGPRRLPAGPTAGPQAPHRRRDPADLMPTWPAPPFPSGLAAQPPRGVTPVAHRQRVATRPEGVAHLALHRDGRLGAASAAAPAPRARGSVDPRPRPRRRDRGPDRRRRHPLTGRAEPAGTLDAPMKVVLRNPRREVEVAGPITVTALLQRLELTPRSCSSSPATSSSPTTPASTTPRPVEIRPVISGGERRRR